MKGKKHIYNLDDQLTFGKHKGKSIRQLLQQQNNYLLWVVDKVDSFAMSDEAWEYAISLNPRFQAFRLDSNIQTMVEVVESWNDDGVETLAHYPWKDIMQVRARFFDYARKVAEDATPINEERHITPVQLRLF